MQEFIQNIINHIDLHEAHEIISGNTRFRDLDSWDSLTAIMVLGMIDDLYKVSIDGNDLISTNTLEELYSLILSKKELDK